jgi:hypothetical protein
MRPTLLSSCARAVTAAEARFRIESPPFAPRSSRVIALDEGAAGVVRELAERRWQGGRFLVLEQAAGAGRRGPAEIMLRDAALGTGVSLSAELDGADVAVMVATAAASAASAAAASVIGDACAIRGIMSAGLVLAESAAPDSVRAVVTALRPNAMVLVVLGDSGDVAEMLTALRV